MEWFGVGSRVVGGGGLIVASENEELWVSGRRNGSIGRLGSLGGGVGGWDLWWEMRMKGFGWQCRNKVVD